MRILKFLLLLFTLLGATRSKAQSDSTIYFFDADFQACSEEKAVIIGVVKKQNDLWKLTCYAKASGSKLVTGTYVDSTLTISDGLFQYFSESGILVTRGSFVEGKKTGTWENWDETGQKKDSAFYESGDWTSKYEWSDGHLLREGALDRKIPGAKGILP